MSDTEPLRDAIRSIPLLDETAAVTALLSEAPFEAEAFRRVQAEAERLVGAIRQRRASGLDAFLLEYRLSSQEGVVLMCLAEALLRIPDDLTRDRLIRDKLGSADWTSHLGQSQSLLVNASTWALMLTGRVILPDQAARTDLPGFWRKLVSRSGEPVLREAVVQAMRILGRQFVMGKTIDEALDRAGNTPGQTYSFDMLGEAARTKTDAERHYDEYAKAIDAIGRQANGPMRGPGISVKLSALHPRYEMAQRSRVMAELVPRLAALAAQAARFDLPLCVDAEEAERLELSLDVITQVIDGLPPGWEGFGMAVQAYQKRAPRVIDWLAETARGKGLRLQLRLVKGAYWDTEIKRAQERGLAGYPVYTRKAATDLSYLTCARRMRAAGTALYPQFATHNALTLASVREIMAGGGGYEFQRLHGMGEGLYEALGDAVPLRVYAPVGSHEDLLPYLVRRLLENGANTSFVNRIADQTAPVEALLADPVAVMSAAEPKPHPRIVLPAALYAPERRNSAGWDLNDPVTLAGLTAAIDDAASRSWVAAPLVAGRSAEGETHPLRDPANREREVGLVTETADTLVAEAAAVAQAAAGEWNRVPAERRAAILDLASDLFEAEAPALMALAIHEAGKTIPDAVAEVREAVDFLRYYATRARADFSAEGTLLPGPTGESNRLTLHGRGVFACISPWNFPLSIFTGQVAAALAAGNAVVAKPAEQTPLMAAQAVRLLHRAGVPVEALGLLPGDGRIGALLVAERRIGGVAFTGSTEAAQSIAKSLAGRGGPIVPLIAETGGQNAMVVDSSALPEQVVADALTGAFASAGQRCSALRLLFLQDDIADKVITMLSGAMAELSVGDPALLATDVGPVIDGASQNMLERHVAAMERVGRLLHACPLPASAQRGSFFAPRLVEIDRLGRLDREVFGPVLHVIRFPGSRLDQVIEAITGTGYGLTLGIHSRIEATIRTIVDKARVGNIYVNRSQIGAVVGTQPFGGEGLSGTGPKAGGPFTLHRFAVERCLSINTAAAGGNASLLALE